MSSYENNNSTFQEQQADSGFNHTGYNHTEGSGFEGAEAAGENIVKSVSVYTPLIYCAILIISLVVFGSQYRKRQIKKLTQLKSIFDEHEARDLYLELKSMQEEALETIKEGGKANKIHEKVLKAALLNRGAEAIRRSFKLKELAPQVEINYKTGSVGENYWQRYQNEVKLIELEFKETIQEAEALQPGWSQMFVVVAKEICFNQALARRYNSIAKRREVAIEEWDLKLDNEGRLIE